MSLINDFSVRIYESPLKEIRDSDSFVDVGNPVHALMLLVDFVTELQMSGITDFIGNSTGRFAHETVAVLRTADRPTEADILAEIIRIAGDVGMTHESVQDDLSGMPEFSIASFSDVHGDKWHDACEAIERLADRIDLDGVYSCMNAYCNRYQAEIKAALNENG